MQELDSLFFVVPSADKSGTAWGCWRIMLNSEVGTILEPQWFPSFSLKPMNKEKFLWGFQPGLDLLKTLARSSATVVLTIGTLSIPAQADVLDKWQFNPAANQLEITLKEGTTPHYFLLAEPLRIILDLPNTTLGNVETQHSYSGAVRQIRVGQFKPDVTRIVLELSPNVILKPEQVQLQAVKSSRNRWVLRPLIAGFQSPAAASPTLLPPATFVENQTPTVKVPPLNRPEASTSSTPAPVTNIPATEPPTATSRSNQQLGVSVSTSQNPKSQIHAQRAVPEIEFGQPLLSSPRQEVQKQPSSAPLPPHNSAEVLDGGQSVEQGVMPAAQTPAQTLPLDTGTVSTTAAKPKVMVPSLNPSANSRAIAPALLLPAGTVLTLRYPGEKAITLQPGSPLQEVLLLKEAIRDRTGNIIAPVGTPVIGRFEMDSSSSRFIAQTIILGGRSLPLSAQSVPLQSNQQTAPNRIEPEQILPVQLREDLR